jgi:rRNA maturation protein Nop10
MSILKKCPHCGSTSTLPIAYGLITEKGHQKNTIKKEWVWGGCKYGQNGTDHCNECGENFGKKVNYTPKNPIGTEKLLDVLNKITYHLEPKNRIPSLYSKAVIKTNGDKEEAFHIYERMLIQKFYRELK